MREQTKGVVVSLEQQRDNRRLADLVGPSIPVPENRRDEAIQVLRDKLPSRQAEVLEGVFAAVEGGATPEMVADQLGQGVREVRDTLAQTLRDLRYSG